VRGDVVTCSPYCQEERRRELQRVSRKIRREEAKAKKVEKKVKKISSIDEFNRKAREMGMTYGQYELYLRLHGKEQKNVV
jgi:hypothetical protein